MYPEKKEERGRTTLRTIIVVGGDVHGQENGAAGYHHHETHNGAHAQETDVHDPVLPVSIEHISLLDPLAASTAFSESMVFEGGKEMVTST
jgi:hypothetical protein